MQFSWVGVRCPKFISKRWQRNTLKLLLYMCIVPHLTAPMTNNRRKPTNKKIWHFTLFSFMMCDIAFFGAAFSLFPFSVSHCFFRLLCFSLLFSHSSFWLSFCDYLGCGKIIFTHTRATWKKVLYESTLSISLSFGVDQLINLHAIASILESGNQCFRGSDWIESTKVLPINMHLNER